MVVMKFSLIFLMISHFTLGILVPDYIITKIGNFCSKHNHQSVTFLTPKNLGGLKFRKKRNLGKPHLFASNAKVKIF